MTRGNLLVFCVKLPKTLKHFYYNFILPLLLFDLKIILYAMIIQPYF
jgi:hypothetical protein